MANTVAIGDTIDGTIGTEDDIDYYKFEAVAGDTVEIFAEDRGGSELYGLIMLFDENGNHLYDNSYFNYDATQQRIQWAITGDGTYYLRYSNRNNWGGFPNRSEKEELDDRRREIEEVCKNLMKLKFKH